MKRAIIATFLVAFCYLLIKKIRDMNFDVDKFNSFLKVLKSNEGGLSNATTDSISNNPKNYCPTPLNGTFYHTNKGITYPFWVSIMGKNKDNDFLTMTNQTWIDIVSKYFLKLQKKWGWHKFDFKKQLLLFYVIWGSGSLTSFVNYLKIRGIDINTASFNTLWEYRYNQFATFSTAEYNLTGWRTAWKNFFNAIN